MSLKYLLSLIFCFFLFSQTKTNEAIKNLEKEGKKDSVTNISDKNGVLDISSYAFKQIFVYYLLNFDVTVFDVHIESQDVSYNLYPYEEEDGLRKNQHSNKITLGELYVASGSDFNTIKSSQFFYRFHFYDNALFFKYKYIKEKDASNPILEWQFNYQRKAQMPYGLDGGFTIGYKNFKIGENSFNGLNLGAQLEFYIFEPFSVSLLHDGTFYKSLTLTSTNLNLKYHIKDYAFTLLFDKSNITDVHFNSFSFGFVKYF
jgi:hypothetical protein